MSHLPIPKSPGSLFSVRKNIAKNASSAKSDAPDGLFSRFAVPALIGLLFFLVARICFVTSFPAILFSEDRKFEHFTEEVFRSELNSNTLNRHYTVADPSEFHLDADRVTLGDASLAARQQSCAAAENYLNKLKKLDREKLSEKHRLTYDIFQDELETELEGAQYLLYDEPLSPTLGIQAQLPVLLAEYAFRTKRDIEDYLTLLTQIPEYFSSVLTFEKAKADEGLFMSSECAGEVVRQCREFIADPESNYLIGTFNEKIDAVKNLTADEKIAYKNRNQSILSGYVVPAYATMIRTVTSFADSGTNTQGLYYFPKGKDYYRYLIKSTVGDDRSVEEIEEAVKVQLVADFTAIQKLMRQYAGTDTKTAVSASSNDILNAAGGDALGITESSAGLPDMESFWNHILTAPGGQSFPAREASDIRRAAVSGADGADGADVSSCDPAAMLDELRQKITQDFPVPPDVSCEVKYVHESLQDYLSPAFYLTSTIDDYTNNVIYINPASNYNELELFTTLAHEGYPGHLYQSVYFNTQNPDLLRSLLDVGGYTEGWATYVEMYAYSLWEEDPLLAALSQRNRSFSLGLASLLDIGVHYRGYSLTQAEAFLKQLGFSSDAAKSLYRAILEAPANYLQYYVGYLNFCSLRDQMQTALGSRFSLREFHRLILENGPAPFYILRKQILPDGTGTIGTDAAGNNADGSALASTAGGT